ncbi:MAG TPA: hypothetical protein VF889_09585, partial [Bacteroidota bacterium]
VYRIFCLGESSTIGFPYMFNASFSSLLRDRLAVLHPGTRIEMVNAGVTAVNSYTVADFTHEIMGYSPDLLIVYMGHNEFCGALGVGSTEMGGASRLAVRAYLSLRQFRTVQLLRSLLTMVAPGAKPRFQEGKSLMEQIVRDPTIAYGSPEYETALREFRRNLLEIVETAQDHGVPILLSTLVSNLRDQPPFVPAFAPATPAPLREKWEQAFREGARLEGAGDLAGAMREYGRAIGLDSSRADAHYRLARCLERGREGAGETGLREYVLAKDMDALRFRASEDFNGVIRAVAAEKKVPLTDLTRAFIRESPGGVPDSTLFWEHVHPRFRGYFLMAKEFCRSMAAARFMLPASAWRWELDRSDSVYRQMSAVTEFDEEVARLRIALLKTRWPFREPPGTFDFHPSGIVQETAWEYVNSRIGWASAHARLGDSFLRAGNLAAAEREYFAIAKNSVYDPEYFNKAGDLQAAQAKFREAKETFTRALEIEETQFTRARRASVELQLAEPAEAAADLEAALRDDEAAAEQFPPGQRVRALTMLGKAYLEQGKIPEAETQLARLSAFAPNAPETISLRAAIAAAPRSR